MTRFFDRRELGRIREEIGRHRFAFENVGDHVPETVEHRLFGDGEHAEGMGHAVQGLSDAVRRQYDAAGKLLDSVERALDATEMSMADAEREGVESMTPRDQ
jgi:hypothetical protein